MSASVRWVEGKSCVFKKGDGGEQEGGGERREEGEWQPPHLLLSLALHLYVHEKGMIQIFAKTTDDVLKLHRNAYGCI